MLLAETESSWEILASVVTVASAVAAVLTFFSYRVFQTWKSYSQQEKKYHEAEQEVKQKNEEEQASLREILLDRYKELYELEKERGIRAIEDLQRQIENLRQEVERAQLRHTHLQDEHESLKREYQTVLALNVQYQNDKRSDDRKIEEMRSEIHNLKTQLEALKA